MQIEHLKTSPDEISYKLAYDAYRNTSFSPDRRAENTQTEASKELNDYLERFCSLVTNEDQEQILLSEFPRFKEGYLSKLNSWLSAHSRCFSVMITGGSNFNNRRHEKTNNSEHNRSVEFCDYVNRASSSIERKLKHAKAPEQVHDEQFEKVKKDILFSIAGIIDVDLNNAPYERSLFQSSIFSRLKRLSKNGNQELINKCLIFIKELQAKHPKPFFTEKHSIWKLGEVAEQKEEKIGIPDSRTIIEGVELFNNTQADRLQIIFPEKPQPEVISILKQNGWHWSPFFKAWQRKLTENARYNAEQIINKFYKVVQPENA